MLHLLLEFLTVLAVAYYTVYDVYELLVAFIFPFDLYTFLLPPSLNTFAMIVFTKSQSVPIATNFLRDTYPRP